MKYTNHSLLSIQKYNHNIGELNVITVVTWPHLLFVNFILPFKDSCQ